MSKTLSKVMIICAMIVILPLMIAGITYSAYYAIDAKIMFDIAINKSCEAQDSFVKVVADGEEVSANTEIVKSHLKQVNFNASAEGYDFVGWFAGDANEYATALQQGDVSYISTENNLNTGMSEYEKLLAVFNLKEYNVFYKYSLTPDGEESTTPPVAGSNHLAWGDALPTLDYDGYDATFVGWRVLGNTEIINTAKFDNENVIVEAVWEKQDKITIKYMNGAELLSSAEVYVNEPHTLKDIPTGDAGYSYAWADAQGNVYTEDTITSTQDLTIYLKTTEIQYNASLNDTDMTFNGNKTFSFTIENFASLDKLFNDANYSSVYSFYDFAGIVYNNQTYNNAQDLAIAIVQANPNGSYENVVISVKVNKNFENTTINGIISGRIPYSTSKVYLESALGTSVEWSAFGSTQSSNNTLNAFLGLTNTKLYTGTSVADKQELEITAIVATINGRMYNVKATGETKMIDIIESLLKVVEVDNQDTFVIDSMQVYFQIKN